MIGVWHHEGLLFTSYVVPTNTLQEWPHEWGTVVSGKQPTALEEAAKKWRLELMEKRKVCPVLWMHIRMCVYSTFSYLGKSLPRGICINLESQYV